LFANHRVLRFYCDPPDWKTEIEGWALQYGEKKVLEWATYRVQPMHEALKRFVTDLQQGRITHDGCPITALHMLNARKEPKPGLKYLLGKPHGAYHQKIDAAMASVLAHEAACDAVAAGETGEPEDTRVILFGW
jgi:phage terminase large subunit-like protein